MHSIQWKKRRTIILIVLTFFFYLLIRINKYEHRASIVIPKTNLILVWEFVADFSNMKYLNPTIVDFKVLAESGNYEHWKYSVEYIENLSNWPYLSNTALAHFEVKPDAKNDQFFVNSTHKTCFLGGYLCLDTRSYFKFSKHLGKYGVVCEEYVEYECPAFLSRFCRREVEFQRSAIMINLKDNFSN